MHKDKDNDVEAGGDINGDVVFKNLDFTEKTIRLGFIRKVYGILMVQLGITFGFVTVFMYVMPVKKFVYENILPMSIGSMLVFFVTIITLMCSTTMRRKAPGNYIFLCIFTVSLSILLGTLCSLLPEGMVWMALGLCTLVTLGLTLFAFQTKMDFTLMHSGMFSLLLILTAIGFATLFIPLDRIGNLLLGGFGAFVFSLLLVHDTQTIIEGDHTLQISSEEYVFAALTLYLDVINLFLNILRILRVM